MLLLWLEAASAGAGREQERGSSPSARAVGLRREWGAATRSYGDVEVSWGQKPFKLLQPSRRRGQIWRQCWFG